ncbi:hypothetical protein DPMN_136569 [Dreissena polymorpha]|uniref:Uncharacterized protein n=1 Tax=Dreissena polymorpha TaxID=45954 RepID=A0A9D4G125_DREPO|nr:hypothetical protein DPMN_136569 [Dreissena polymorpha]
MGLKTYPSGRGNSRQGHSRYSGWSLDTLSACDTLRYFIVDEVTRGNSRYSGWSLDTLSACDTWRYFIVDELTPAFGAVTLQRDCACYGSDVNIDSIKANCTDAGGRIYVKRVIRAAKATNLNCSNPATGNFSAFD